MNGSVTVHISSAPEHVWALVSDITRTGEFSPETLEAEWLDGASGPAVGVKFRGHVKRNGRGPMYWTTCKIVACEPNEVFGFAVVMRDKPVNTWTYRLVPAGDGTDVTESFELAPTLFNRIYWSIIGRARGKTNERGMRTTLERIKTAVEKS